MRRALRGGAWALALVGLAAGGLMTGCKEDDAPLVCIEDQEKTANPDHDHECKGNVGCWRIGVWEIGCHCDYCADERCVLVKCYDDFNDLGPEAGSDGGLDAAKADANTDAAKSDAAADDATVDAPGKDAAMLDAASAAYKDLEWVHSSYQGGFNPHTTTSKLKAGALDLQTSSLAGGVTKTCKVALTAQQLATLLVEAGKVSWSAVKPNYAGAGCSYPGDSGELKITLIPKQGASTTVSTKWCVGGGKPSGLPADLVTFLAAVDKLHAAACP